MIETGNTGNPKDLEPGRESETPNSASRRQFLMTGAKVSGAALALPLSSAAILPSTGTDELKIGLVGCGGRGRGAADNCLESSEGVKLVAIGDLFPEQLESAKKYISARHPKDVDLPKDRCFSGFDAYKKVIACDVDIVLFATPPAFRAEHLEAAIDADKHVFIEKPVAVDPATVRRVLEASQLAEEKELAIVSGTQRRHQSSYLETMKRIKDGAIGDVVEAQCYWNQGGLWCHERRPEYSDLEWQIRNWLYFTWASGDHIVEQHIHNIDVCNWAMGGPPELCIGLGGRQVRTEEKYGNVFDHFAIEFEYSSGARVHSFCRQQDGTKGMVQERLIGTKGTSFPGGYIQSGKEQWRFPRKQNNNPYVQEHANLIASIRAGTPLNEGKRVAESTMTAIMGRMAAYTGQQVTWGRAMKSKLSLLPRAWEFGDNPVDPVAMPGRTRLK